MMVSNKPQNVRDNQVFCRTAEDIYRFTVTPKLSDIVKLWINVEVMQSIAAEKVGGQNVGGYLPFGAGIQLRHSLLRLTV